MTNRNTTIDFLRGLSLILIIMIHGNSSFSEVPIATSLANYSQFAVQVFVFCSAFLYFDRKKDAPFNFLSIWKRFKRLLIPYYIYLLFFFGFIFIVQQQPISLKTITQWIFLQGDYELDWLVVLFLYFVFLMPLIRIIKGKKWVFWLFFLISLGSSILLLFIKIPVHFRLIMWLPWSVVLFYSYFYSVTKNKNMFILASIGITAIVFLTSQYVLGVQHESLDLRANKYPPNIFYLSYGLLCISLLIPIYEKFHINKLPTQKIFNFASKYSYQLFFIHFLFLYGLWEIPNYKQLHWWGFFIIITILSLGSMWIWSKKNYFFSILKKAN